MAKKKNEEMKKRAEDLKRQQAEQAAAVNIRKTIAKFKSVTPDTYDAIKKELAEALVKELDDCGSQKTKVNEEADAAVEAAGKRVEQIKEMDRKRKEAIEKANALLAELVTKTESAEVTAKQLAEKVEKFKTDSVSDTVTEAKVKSGAATVESLVEDATTEVADCLEFIKSKQTELRILPSAPAKKPVGEKKDDETKEEEEKPTLPKLQARVSQTKMAIDKEAKIFKTAHEGAIKKAAANAEMKKIHTTWVKYDKDKDGFLSKKEIGLYSKTEYGGFKMPDDAIDQIFKVLVAEGGKGVKEDDFQLLKMSIGVAREMERDRERRKERTDHEEEIAKQKANFQAKIDDYTSKIKDTENEINEFAKVTRTLTPEGRKMKSVTMIEKANEVEESSTACQAKIDTTTKEVDEFASAEDEVEKELAKWLENEKRRLKNLVKNLTSQMSKATSTLQRFKEEAIKKDTAEVKQLSIKALAMMKNYQKEKSLSIEALFNEIDSKKSGAITAENFAPFVAKIALAAHEAEKAEAEKVEEGKPAKTVEDALTADDLKRVFTTIDEEKTGSVVLETFGAIMRVLMKVVKDVALTEEFTIKDAKTVRRLEAGDVVEVLEGPQKEETSDVIRVRARTLADSLEGWVTIAGNQGSIFLKEGGATWKVLKETILTENFEIEASKEERIKVKERSTRKLKPGELLELREWGKKQEVTGITRMKCKVKSDGMVGYVTTLGNTGIKFVELV